MLRTETDLGAFATCGTRRRSWRFATAGARRILNPFLAAVSIGTFFCFCVGGGMLISFSPAGPFRRPAIAKQSIPPFDRPRIPLFWCQVLQRVVIRSGRRSKCRCLVRFHTDGRGRRQCRRLARFHGDGRGGRQCPPILTHRATAMRASVLQSHVPVEVFEAADVYLQPFSIFVAILTCVTAHASPRS